MQRSNTVNIIVSPDFSPIPSSPIDSGMPQDISVISKIGSSIEKKRKLADKQKNKKNIEDIIKRGLDKLKQKAIDQQARELERKTMVSTATLWHQLEEDMIHKGNYLDPHKAVMHSRQMIKE